MGFARRALAVLTALACLGLPLVIGQPAPSDGVAGLGDLLRTLVVSGNPANDRELDRARIPRPAFYLLRPDGHVGLAGGRLEAAAVARYVSERL